MLISPRDSGRAWLFIYYATISFNPTLWQCHVRTLGKQEVIWVMVQQAENRSLPCFVSSALSRRLSLQYLDTFQISLLVF